MEIFETIFCASVSAFAFILVFHIYGQMCMLIYGVDVSGFFRVAYYGFLNALCLFLCVSGLALLLWITADFLIGSGKPITYLINRYF